MIKKIIVTLMIFTILLSSIMPKSFASEDFALPGDIDNIGNSFNSLYNKGEATINSDADTGIDSQVLGIDRTPSQDDTLAHVLSMVLAIVPLTLNKLMSLIVLHGEDNVDIDGEGLSLFTIESLLTNQYKIFDINLFTETEEGPNSEFSNTLKENAAIWYVAIRNIAIAICAIIIIYVGIRMAISTTAEGKATYKKMLTNWFIGIVLLFIIHYIVLALIIVSNIFVNFIKTAIENDTNTTGMEIEILTNVFNNISKADGWNKFYYLTLYVVLTYYELKFFIMYLFRVFKIFIMTIIAPLMSVTYPIDTLGDGKAQGFNNWFKNILVEIFLQPLHLVIYVVFIYSAGEIAKTFPIIGILFIIALDKGEQIIRSALKIKGKGLKDIKLFKGKK